VINNRELETISAAEEEYKEIEAALDAAGIPRAHILAGAKTTVARIVEDSPSDVVNRVRALARERDGWRDIAESNRIAYSQAIGVSIHAQP
jgi:hypothetical protein